MANEVFPELARMVAYRDGTVLYPKGDGRVEIPHGIVRLVGWRDKSVVWIGKGPGCLVLSNAKPESPIGRISVSMERARIPMSILRASSMGGPVAASLDLVAGTIVVRRSLGPADLADLEGTFREAGEPACRRLMSILGGVSLCIVADRTPEPPRQPRETSSGGEPRLFLMGASRPTVVRVIGMPFAFQAHWVPSANGSAGRLVPHSGGCALCALRAPERMSLVPVIRRVDGLHIPGFLLAQEELRAKIARQLSGRNPIDFDLVLYFAPFQDGMCSVHKAPPEAVPEGLVRSAQAACSDPDRFVAEAFGGGPPEGHPGRAPMFIVEGHFAEEARPRNLMK